MGDDLITTPDGDVFRHASGVGLDHLDMLRSATKIATISAIATLVQSGRLALADPVSKYVPAFGGDKSLVTVRHLLSMNSGLPSASSSASDEMPLEVAADTIAQVPLRAAPGSRFIYGNLGLTVAGRVAEVASGQPWPVFFEAALAKPLGMTFSYVPVESGRLGGGGRTNTESYARLLRMHLRGGLHGDRRILSTALVEELQRSNGSLFVNPVPQITPHGYGMGWWFDEVDAAGQPTVVSDAGAWGAYPWLDRNRRYAAFLFVRKMLAASVPIQRRLRPLIEQALDA